MLGKVNFKATAPVLWLGRGRDRSDATMPYTPGVKKPRLPPDNWHEVTASARNPGQPQMKDTREGQARVNPGAGGRLQSAQANRAIPWIPRGTRRTGGNLGLEAAQRRTPGVRLSPGHPEGLDQGVASHPPLRGCLSGRCRRRRRRSCIH